MLNKIRNKIVKTFQFYTTSIIKCYIFSEPVVVLLIMDINELKNKIDIEILKDLSSEKMNLDLMKKKRLEILFGDPNLMIEDIVKPIGEKELKEEVEKLKKEKEDLLKSDGDNGRIDQILEERHEGVKVIDSD